jgi:SAM-dependent methyltransferase
MEIKESVKEKYGEAARRVIEGKGPPSDCCSEISCCDGSAAASCDPITSNLYDEAQAGQIPDTALKASLGCGNPTALAKLNPGEIVLDLGSGGGIDVLLSARRVGPSGKAYGLDMTGLDMTDDMHSLARENQRKAGVKKSNFLREKSNISRCRMTAWT